MSLRVIRRIVSHHDGRRIVVSFDEQSALVVRARIHRSANGLHAAGLGPLGDFVKKRVRQSLVVDALEEAEESRLLFVILVVVVVDDADDAADALAVFVGDDRMHVGVLEERILRHVQQDRARRS